MGIGGRVFCCLSRPDPRARDRLPGLAVRRTRGSVSCIRSSPSINRCIAKPPGFRILEQRGPRRNRPGPQSQPVSTPLAPEAAADRPRI